MNLKNRVLSFFPVVTAACLGLHATASAQDATTSSLKNSLADQLQYVLEAQDRYIIRFRQNQGPISVGDDRLADSTDAAAPEQRFESSAAVQAVNSVAGRIHRVMEKRNVVVASLDAEARHQLSLRPDVESISPDPVRRPMSQTLPVSYEEIQATQLVQQDTGAIKVCVIDTGINGGHEDLPDQNTGLTGSATGPAVGDWFHDGYGHGTHVAGTIAAYDNSYGSVGVYPGVNIHVVKVFDDNGGWTYASNIVEAIDQCAQAGAKVVNMSLGGPGSSNYEDEALTEFEEQGILMVAAAGNSGNGKKAYPASYDSVISVGAINLKGDRARFSQYNEQVEMAAPGRYIYSTYPQNRYKKLSGTSMATPHVAGGAALIWSFFPECTNRHVRQVLNATAVDKGDAGRDIYYGFGLLNVQAAYDEIAGYGCEGNTENGGDSDETAPVEIVKEGITIPRGMWARYSVDVPEGVSQLNVTMTGGTGNADLYVHRGRKTTRWHWTCRSVGPDTEETCSIDLPKADTWNIGIKAITGVANAKLTYSYSFDEKTEEEQDSIVVEKNELSKPAGQWQRFSVLLPEGTSQFTVTLEGGIGNPDLYVNRGRRATRWHWKCVSSNEGSSDTCIFNQPRTDRHWSIGVYAKEAYSGVTLKYRIE